MKDLNIKKTLHIWMNIPSHYQNDLFNALTCKYDKVEVVYAHSHDDTRKAQGWSLGNAQYYHSQTIGIDLKIWQVIPYIFKNRKALHIVNGIWAEKVFLVVIILLNLFGVDFLIYSEAPNPTKKRNTIKIFLLNFCIRPLSKLLIYRAKGFLAVSAFAVSYFESLGVKNEIIYPFGYFRNVSKQETKPTNNSSISLVYIGQLIERKGVFTLLKAFEKLVAIAPSTHLSIIGMGNLEQPLKDYVASKKIQPFVSFLGVVDSGEIPIYLSKADLLILPSLFDGWGVVVNEALQCGIPVLVSDQCGAKELIINGQNGFLFKANNIGDLTEKMADFIRKTPEEKALMKYQTKITGTKIDIHKITNYLTECLAHALNLNNKKPTVPWLYD